MDVFSVRIPEDLKNMMDALSSINWSEEIRFFLRQKVQEEMTRRNIDPIKLEKAVESSYKLQEVHTAEEDWDSTKELRKWRDQRRS